MTVILAKISISILIVIALLAFTLMAAHGKKDPTERDVGYIKKTTTLVGWLALVLFVDLIALIWSL